MAEVNQEEGMPAGEEPSALEMIVMLYDGAIKFLAGARAALEEADLTEKTKLINKAVAIIDHLKSALDAEKGGDISGNLGDLYTYMRQRLVIANLKNDPAILLEVEKLLLEIKSAWDELATQEKNTI